MNPKDLNAYKLLTDNSKYREEIEIYSLLFKPFDIKGLYLKNRLVMPPIGTSFKTADCVSRRLKSWYVERAKGGVGMIVTQHAFADLHVAEHRRTWTLSEDECVSKLRDLTDAIHAHQTIVVAQLAHPGRRIKQKNGCAYPVSASSISSALAGCWSIPTALTLEDIQSQIETFAKGAKRAKEAGFDAVQLHAAHGYLIWSFLSPFANKRKDRYGGDRKNRARFLIETLSLIREGVGKDFPVFVRMNGSDYSEGGIEIEDARAYARNIEEAGADAISISAAETSRLFPGEYMVPPRAVVRGCNVHLAAAIKKVVGIPVSVAGRIDNPTLAERILEEGKADLIEMGRGLVCDPELPKKAYRNQTKEIRPCIACNHCEDIQELGLPIECSVNPIAGREYKHKVTQPEKPLRVMVIGGGPAGMEAARMAAAIGHRVTLCEKENELGGQLKLASLSPFKSEMRELINWYKAELDRLRVRINTNHRVMPSTIQEESPDITIIATGAVPSVPSTLRTKQENVVNACDVLVDKSTIGERVVIVGGGLIGCEIADLLSEEGKKVTIVEMLGNLGMLLERVKGMNEMLLLRRICERGVKIVINTKVEGIVKEGVIVNHLGMRRLIEADTIVLATGMKENRDLVNSLSNAAPVYCIGDCRKVRKLADAIFDGYAILMRIQRIQPRVVLK